MPNASEFQKTACILCECNCGLEVQLGGDDGRRLIRFRGDREHPASKGYACEKPHRLDYYQNGPDRVTEPLRRKSDGTFEVIDWDTAISEVAARLSNVRDTWSGESIFYYGGGGQGNHLPGAYASATMRALGARYRSNALAQEKTGEFWVSEKMLGAYTRGDFEHAELSVFIGKNPWHSHSIPRARVTLKEIAKDPKRKMIVIDPRRSETAELADLHLRVRPGTDAWLLAALAATIVDEDGLDRAFLNSHATGLEPVLEHLRDVPIDEYCERSGVPQADVRRAAMMIIEAKSVASFEDLGVQMNRHSTLVSYLHRLTWLLTGNLGKPGTQYVPTPLIPLASGGSGKTTPVLGAPIIGGLVPCNVIADEILTDHPARYRAMVVEAANPAHSLADSPRFREALATLDTLVVIDVAMSETARLADYVLPASTQYEKAEATFFNFEFPDNYFHLRRPLLEPPPGPLSEAEIHTRLVEALGGMPDELITPLRDAAAQDRDAYAKAFFGAVMMDPQRAKLAPVILYRTLGPTLGADMAEAAVLWGAAFRAAMSHGESLARAGFGGSPQEAADKLFDAILDSPSGLIFAIDEWSDVMERITTPDNRVQLEIPELLEEMSVLSAPLPKDDDFPFVLSAGERRAFTANTIVRDPAWRKKDSGGALRISPEDARELGIETGGRVRLSTRRASAIVEVQISESMQPKHVSLPNGLGLSAPSENGRDPGESTAGIAPNELTANEDRDKFAGTPWHKSVPANIEAL